MIISFYGEFVFFYTQINLFVCFYLFYFGLKPLIFEIKQISSCFIKACQKISKIVQSAKLLDPSGHLALALICYSSPLEPLLKKACLPLLDQIVVILYFSEFLHRVCVFLFTYRTSGFYYLSIARVLYLPPFRHLKEGHPESQCTLLLFDFVKLS